MEMPERKYSGGSWRYRGAEAFVLWTSLFLFVYFLHSFFSILLKIYFQIKLQDLYPDQYNIEPASSLEVFDYIAIFVVFILVPIMIYCHFMNFFSRRYLSTRIMKNFDNARYLFEAEEDDNKDTENYIGLDKKKSDIQRDLHALLSPHKKHWKRFP